VQPEPRYCAQSVDGGEWSPWWVVEIISANSFLHEEMHEGKVVSECGACLWRE
jgi:hypothetical protein